MMENFQPDEIMINNYIQDKLNDIETEKVELWLVDNPEVMQNLEMDQMFKQGIIKHDLPHTPESKTSSFNWHDWFKLPSLVIGAVTASLIIIPLALTTGSNSLPGNTLYNYNEFVISTTRSASEIIEIKPTSKFISLILPLEESWLKEYESFTVVLNNENNNLQSIHVAPNWDNELPLSLKLQSLEEQQINLSIYPSGKSTGKELTKFTVVIIPQV